MVDVVFAAKSGVGFSPGVGNMRAPRLALSNLEVPDDVEIGDVVATVSVTNPGLGTWSYALVDDADGVFDLVGSELRAGDEIFNDDETPEITLRGANGPKTVTQAFTLNKGVPARAWRFANNSPVRRDGGGYWLRAS
ncbi:hypothetical protein [Rhizobium sp. RU36D]|uniref:hypothetical protein n=1 Tax=Rhizobium sp. RU36D TaxID=1907415 RepID=UPI0009D79F4B|nr:hypothetical protein [Rhizobium sp. RU36D]SMD18398.1 hypothetical protein SAMN05880593_1351 [Rhizobium sp. RU36D]